MKYEIVKIKDEPQFFNVYDSQKFPIAYIELQQGHLTCHDYSTNQIICEDYPPSAESKFVSLAQCYDYLSKFSEAIVDYFETQEKIVPYYNEEHTQYAVLVSHGYGTGWSSDNGDIRLAYDSRIIKWYSSLTEQELNKIAYFDTPEQQVATDFIHSLGYNIAYITFLGLKPNMIEWVDSDATWRIHEYDGSETIEYLNKKDWVHFSG